MLSLQMIFAHFYFAKYVPNKVLKLYTVNLWFYILCEDNMLDEID